MKQYASKHLAVAALAGIGLGLAALPAAGADNTPCTGTLTGVTINGNLVVPNGKICTLAFVTVTGNVLVGTGASLSVTDSLTVSENLEANQCGFVRIVPSHAAVSVGGNVVIQSCAQSSAYDGSHAPVTIAGNFVCQSNSAPCAASLGSIAGNATVSGNSGTSSVGGNQIGGNLLCFRNTAITGGGNSVAGQKLGQCASF